MSVYMITYDLNSEGQNYEKVIKTIKESASVWCSYWKSAYLIKSNLSPDDIQSKLKPYLDSNDRLIIIEVKNNKQGWLTTEQWKFINDNIFS